MTSNQADAVFYWCVQLLKDYAHRFHMTYEEINVWVFCIIWPIVTVLLIVGLIVAFNAGYRRGIKKGMAIQRWAITTVIRGGFFETEGSDWLKDVKPVKPKQTSNWKSWLVANVVTFFLLILYTKALILYGTTNFMLCEALWDVWTIQAIVGAVTFLFIKLVGKISLKR